MKEPIANIIHECHESIALLVFVFLLLTCMIMAAIETMSPYMWGFCVALLICNIIAILAVIEDIKNLKRNTPSKR